MNTMACLVFGVVAAAGAAAQAPSTEEPRQPTTIDWRSSPEDHPGALGVSQLFWCPPQGPEAPGSVWGTDVYTADSAICPAAVHAGRITAAEGGTVTVYLVAGRETYAGASRHGVDSLDYGDAWEESFVFVDGPEATPEEGPPRLAWTATAARLVGLEGAGPRFVFLCPPGGTPEKVWGTDVYTSDSSICAAAVHAGKISAAAGGRVTLTIRPGQESYQGSTRHGVRSESYGAWEGSFSIE